jgi:hypothetical protein
MNKQLQWRESMHPTAAHLCAHTFPQDQNSVVNQTHTQKVHVILYLSVRQDSLLEKTELPQIWKHRRNRNATNIWKHDWYIITSRVTDEGVRTYLQQCTFRKTVRAGTRGNIQW